MDSNKRSNFEKSLDRDEARRRNFSEADDNGFIPRSSASLDIGEDYRTLQEGDALMAYNGETEPAAREKKSALEQVAKTARGRAMQVYAENVVGDYNDDSEKGYDFNQPCDAVACYSDEMLADKQALVTDCMFRDADGNIHLKEELSATQLKALREELNDTPLIAAKDEESALERVRQLEIINNTLEAIEEVLPGVELKEQMENAPKQFIRVLHEFDAKKGAIIQAINEKRWSDLNQLNIDLLVITEKIRQALDMLRKNDPDRMITMADELAGEEGRIPGLYKRALVSFVGTHNSFHFSPDSIRNLEFFDRSRYMQALLEAYRNRPKKDDVVSFMIGTTQIPEERLMQVISQITN